MLWFRLALREIFHHRKFAVFFILNLCLGITGFVVLDAYRGSTEMLLAAQSREMLGADFALRALQPITDAHRQVVARSVGAGTLEARRVDLYSMLASASASRLVELRAIDENFPFYGEIILEKSGRADVLLRRMLNQESIVWIDTELRLQLGVEIGDVLSIGDASFRVQDILEKDSGPSATGISLAPRVYLGLDQLEKTNLIRKGSRIVYQSYFKLPSTQFDVDVLAQEIRQEIRDPTLKIQTHRTASRELARALTSASDFLGLVSLATLFLAAIGVAYAFRAHWMSRLREIAILMSLGVRVVDARRIYVLELLLLGLAAGILALLSGVLCMLLAPALLGNLFPVPLQDVLQLRLGLRSAAVALGVATLSGFLLALPWLVRLRSFSPATLFRENAQPTLEISPRSVIWFLPSLLFFALLSVVQARSFVLGIKFLLLLVAVCALLMIGFWIFFVLVRASSQTSNLVLRLALREVVRRKVASFACFVSIALCSFLISLVPQLHALLAADFQQPAGAALPSLFLFDIQEEQVTDLQTYLTRFQKEPIGLSPLIRARLLAIDGKTVAAWATQDGFATREDEDQRWTRERSYNLTIREKLLPSERIVAGRPFLHESSTRHDTATNFDAQAEISVEEAFAKRMGVKLGSVMQFDVQGVEVSGVIVSLRKVRWNGFEPNFFVQFQSGVLDEAPKTYLAAVASMAPQMKTELQNGLVAKFPNVSIVDISRVVEKIQAIFHKIELAMQVLSFFSVGVGILLLILIVRQEVLAMRWEINLLKVLGARYSSLRAVLLLRFVGIVLVSTLFGVGFSMGATTLLAHNVFEIAGSPNWMLAVAVVGWGTLLSVPAVLFVARKVLRERALRGLVSDLTDLDTSSSVD